MTEGQGQPPSNGPTRHGRHSRDAAGGPTARNRTWIILALVVAIVAAAGVITWFVKSDSTTSASTATAATTNSTRPSATGSQPAAASAVATADPSATSDSGCSVSGGSLTVAVSPDIATAIAPLFDGQGGARMDGGCEVTLAPIDSADFVAGNGVGRSSVDP